MYKGKRSVPDYPWWSIRERHTRGYLWRCKWHHLGNIIYINHFDWSPAKKIILIDDISFWLLYTWIILETLYPSIILIWWYIIWIEYASALDSWYMCALSAHHGMWLSVRDTKLMVYPTCMAWFGDMIHACMCVQSSRSSTQLTLRASLSPPHQPPRQGAPTLSCYMHLIL